MKWSKILIAGSILLSSGVARAQTADQRRSLEEIGQVIAAIQLCPTLKIDGDGLAKTIMHLGYGLDAANDPSSEVYKVIVSAGQGALTVLKRRDDLCPGFARDYGAWGSRAVSLGVNRLVIEGSDPVTAPQTTMKMPDVVSSPTTSVKDTVIAQSGYTEAQLKLAGQIGSVMGLVDRCGIVPLPSAAILRAMKAERLQEADMTRETAFKSRVVEQVRTMKVIDGVGANAGRSEADRRKEACGRLADMYGPKGYVRPGLAAPN